MLTGDIKKPENQKELVLMHLQNNPLTMPDAVINYNIYRLAAIIFQLKKDGHNITSEDIEFTNRFGHKGSYSKYTLIQNQ